jgi:hypothetical protein
MVVVALRHAVHGDALHPGTRCDEKSAARLNGFTDRQFCGVLVTSRTGQSVPMQ